MSIVSITPYYIGQSGQGITRWKLIVTDNLATVTAAGYLNPQNLMGYSVSPTDIFDVYYSYTGTSTWAGTGTYVELLPTISNSIITLNQVVDSGNVPLPTLPVVANDFVQFSGTAGAIKDSGLLPSASSQAYVVTSPGSLTSGNIPFLNDANGTLNTGRTPSATTAGYKVVMSPGTITVGNLLKAADANGTIADQGVAMKSVAQAAVAGGAAAQTVTDAFCTSAACVVASWNDTSNAVSIQKVAAGNGSFVVTSSGDPGASHLNYIITK